MTLVLGVFTLTDSFLVTDRLVSLQRRGGGFAREHEDTSNKNVIYVADDGVIALGYTGRAYVHGIPTDKFIAECLYDEGIPNEVFMGNRIRRLSGKVGDRLFALRRLCSENWTAGFVRILAVGYRDYRRLLRPFFGAI